MNFGDPRIGDSVWERLQPCPMSGCWLWTGNTNEKGHPLFIVRKKQWRVHRWIFGVEFGFDVVEGRHVEPSCGIDGCCNPHHHHQISKAELRRRKRIQTRAWRNRALKGPDGKKKSREYHLRQRFGITLADEQRMIEEQDNACAICRRLFDESASKRRHVDHDHETGRVRGVLCATCNVGLGAFGDDENRLTAAVEYLRKHNKDNG